MLQTVLFVINPIAGGTNKDHVEPTIKNWSQSSGYDCDIMHTTGNNDKDRLHSQLKEKDYDLVMSVGGDGTLKICAEVLINSSTALGMMPMGSANGMAQSLQLPSGVSASLQMIEDPHFRTIDLLCFNDNDLAIHISDFGINARLVKRFEESGNRGFLSYAGSLYEEMSQQHIFHMQIDTDKGHYEADGVMLAIANARSYGTGALLNSTGKMDDGQFELCIIKKLSLTDIASHVVTLPDEDSDHLEVIQARQATIKLDSKVAFQVDGEVRPATDRMEVKILPRAIKFLVPPKQ